jgi:hypothetical protein
LNLHKSIKPISRAVCEAEDGGQQKTLPVLAVVVLHDTERNTIRADVITEIGLHVRSDLPESVVLDGRSNSDQLSIASALDKGLPGIDIAIQELAMAVERAITPAAPN